MEFENTILYKEMIRRHSEIPSPAPNLVEEFKHLSHVLQQHGKYIVRIFPEYTPHDPTLHLDHLFGLSDRLLGHDLYARMNATELFVLAFALYTHDWGMAVSDAELRVLRGEETNSEFSLSPGEPEIVQKRLRNAARAGTKADTALFEYVRETHGLRSGARLRKTLLPLGTTFSDAVAKAAEGHTLNISEIRNVHKYPYTLPVYGQTINLAAISIYVRIVDLLDIGEDRTPYALWKFVAPENTISSIEWKKHRVLSPVSLIDSKTVPRVLIGGSTDDVEVYAALADLKEWVNNEFSSSISILRNIGGIYDLRLDSNIKWHIEPKNFKPILTKFELDRKQLLGLISNELYEDQPYAFIRELLQNSIDAIDTREEILKGQDAQLEGKIQVSIQQENTYLQLEWEDNGIGMDESILQSYFSSIGCSWYESRSFSDLHLAHYPISQFGLGILSCFSVSDTLRVTTRRDPGLLGSSAGLDVQIPSQLAHFRIRESEDIPIGTKIVLQIRDPEAKGITPEGIRKHLNSFAGYVRHKITISIDGCVQEINSLARWNPAVEIADIYRNPALIIQGLNTDPEESILKHASVHTISFGEKTNDYTGYYSALLPTTPTQLIKRSFHEWTLSGTEIDTHEYFDNSAEEVFIKGVLVGSGNQHEPKTRCHRTGLTGTAGGTDWFGPKIAVNLPKASGIQINLSRGNAKVVNEQWRLAMWEEIAEKLKADAFANCSESLESSAVALGIASDFCGIPNHALNQIVSSEDTPVLVLRANMGLVWERYGMLLSKGEIIDAPFEITYSLDNYSRLSGLGPESGLSGWSGVDAVMILEHYQEYKSFPWLAPLLRFVRYLLVRDGYLPTEIQLVESPPNEAIPLVCRIWKRVFEKDQAPDWSDKSNLVMDLPQNAPLQRHPLVLGVILGTECPQVVRFPDCIANYACYGSRYWNALHPKIYPIVRAFLMLDERIKNGQTSADTVQEYTFLTSSKFIGYVVPCRSSGVRLGLEVQSRLIELIEQEGLAKDLVPLAKEDFYPGTVGKYKNPYHYDLSLWKQVGSGLGKPFS